MEDDLKLFMTTSNKMVKQHEVRRRKIEDDLKKNGRRPKAQSTLIGCDIIVN
jgi:hypothetical protein